MTKAFWSQHTARNSLAQSGTIRLKRRSSAGWRRATVESVFQIDPREWRLLARIDERFRCCYERHYLRLRRGPMKRVPLQALPPFQRTPASDRRPCGVRLLFEAVRQVRNQRKRTQAYDQRYPMPVAAMAGA